MKSILITCLRDEINLIQASHLVGSLRRENPGSEVSILTFKDLESSSKTVAEARNVFTIDRHKIEHLKSGALYSDAFAVNALMSDLAALLETDWDHVVNFSNDEISGYLLPMLSSSKTSGTTVSLAGSPRTSDRWSAYRNFYLTNSLDAPVEEISCLHHSAGVPYVKGAAEILLNQDFTMLANQNFARIRKGKGDSSSLIVGISLVPSKSGQDIGIPFLVDLVETLESSPEYKVVLLLKGSEEEKAVADELNRQFQNSLISVNMDTTAMPSVLANLDFLVTRTNAVCAMADAMETKIIEIAANLKNSLAMNEGNYVIELSDEADLCDDIAFLLNQESGTVLPVGSKNSRNRTFARASDDTGLLRTQIRGDLNIEEELEYHVARCYHHALLGYPIDGKLLSDLRENAEREALSAFVTKGKEELTGVVKILLAALRSLQAMRQSERNAPKFVQYLGQLISFGKEKNIAQAAISLFEADIESIEGSDSKSNMEKIEKRLFSLKADLQTIAKIFENLLEESPGREAQKEL